jgi:hypothetical protein
LRKSIEWVWLTFETDGIGRASYAAMLLSLKKQQKKWDKKRRAAEREGKDKTVLIAAGRLPN